MLKHNKKRNVGIIYELMLRHISEKLIEGKQNDAQCALNIIEKSFNADTEIYREFRLFNALANSTVSTPSVAATILSEARSAARRIDRERLDREKSVLIKEINYNLNDKNFYKRQVPNYREYASIQNLLNSWRLGDQGDLTKTVQLESNLVDHLLREKNDSSDISDHVTPDVDSLVVKILSEKFNKKFGKSLSEEQKQIVRTYVFSIENDNGEKIQNLLSEIKNSTISRIDLLESDSTNKTVLEKIPTIKEKINQLDTNELNDNLISKYLTVSQLRDTLLEVENEQQ